MKFLEPWSVKEAAGPVALAAAGDRVYVVDRDKCAVLIYDGQGRFLKSVGSKGKGPEQFRDPAGIAIGPEGRVFVADKGNARVQLLDADGKFLWSFGSSLEDPKGVSVGTDGRVYVAETDNERVKVFTKEGIFLYGFGSKGKEQGQFRGPEKVGVSVSDDIFVLDNGNERVQRFDPATRFVQAIAIEGDDLSLDAYGFLYVPRPGQGQGLRVRSQGPARQVAVPARARRSSAEANAIAPPWRPGPRRIGRPWSCWSSTPATPHPEDPGRQPPQDQAPGLQPRPSSWSRGPPLPGRSRLRLLRP